MPENKKKKTLQPSAHSSKRSKITLQCLIFCSPFATALKEELVFYFMVMTFLEINSDTESSNLLKYVCFPHIAEHLNSIKIVFHTAFFPSLNVLELKVRNIFLLCSLMEVLVEHILSTPLFF